MRNALRIHRKKRRGQAMLEYSMMLWLLAVMFIMGWTWKTGGVRTGPANETLTDTKHHWKAAGGSGDINSSGQDSIFGLMVNAYQVYQQSYYYALCSTLP